MKIELKKLQFQYFKGAKNLTVDFSHRTSISGMNASGKTRVFDAFTWLLFGKDSEDVKDFNIKCLDENNQPLHRVDHVVTGLLSVDGIDTKFERIYKEKWTKKRGEETPEFNGHETLFFVNGVPHQLKEYQEKVESILPESLFKQVTNPAFFNSMKWTDRRAMLFQMAGKISDADILATNKGLKAFYESIIGKSFEEFKKELAAKKKLLKESIVNVPARIDEVSRAIVPDPDYAQINVDIDKLNARIFQIDGLIASDAENYNAANKENQEKQSRIYEIERQISKIENDAINEAQKGKLDIERRISGIKSEIDWLNRNLTTLTNRKIVESGKIQTLTSDNDDLRVKWEEVNESDIIFDDNEFNCPACKRPFEADDIEAKKAEMTANFNKNKQAKLQSTTSTGKANKAEIERLSAEILSIQKEIDSAKQSIEVKQKELDSIVIPENTTIPPDPQIKTLQAEITELQKSIKVVDKSDNAVLISEKVEINTALDGLKKQLNIKESNERHNIRKQELIDSEKSLSQQIADIEKQEFQCEAFTRAKINMIEDKINSMFTLVKFKMFNTLINGGNEECCESLINGVPYSDTNAAAKVQGGLDIIRTLSKHYDIYAPVFVDNRESTTEIPEMDCQVISLYVDPACKELKIVNN